MTHTLSLKNHFIDNTEDYADSSRVWIYQADRELTKGELVSLRASLQQFVSSWTSHSMQVKAAAKIFYDRFIVFMADESHASVGGCSQDTLMKYIQDIQRQYNISLLDRLSLAIKVDNNILIYHKDDLINSIEEGEVSKETMLFDNLVNNKEKFENSWLKPIHLSWLSRFINA